MAVRRGPLLSSMMDRDHATRLEERWMSLVISDESLREAGLSEGEALIEFACHLFEAGRLGLWGAARLARLSRSDFESELRTRRIAWIRPDERDLADDLAALDRLGIRP